MKASITQDDINGAVWSACDAFRGVVDPSVYKDYTLTMLFLKYLSDVWKDQYKKYEEEYGDEPELIQEMMASERFVLPEQSSFYHLYDNRNLPGNGERIDKALHAIEDANINKLRGVFQDISFNSNRLGDIKQKNDLLSSVLEGFSHSELDLSPSRVGNLDVIGNAYEFLIKNFAASAGKKAGEFYTPPEVSELIAELVDPQEGDAIGDPACGSASLLMKVGRKIREHHGSKRYALHGQEAIGSTWALAKMNLFLHGEDNHRIEWGDTIRNPKLLNKDESLTLYNVVVANPPFSLDKWGHDSAAEDKWGRFRRGIPPKTKGDYAFILHMIETMNPKDGRVGVVVPHGVLFRGGSEGKIRQQLIEENLLDAVIGLPEKLFYGTGIPAAVLIFKRGKSDKNVLFIDASREYRDGKNQNFLRPEDIQRVVETYQARETVDKYAYLATFEDIKENGFNLNIPRYVDTFEEEEEIDLMAVRKEREQLKAELVALETEMDGYLRELGYGS